MADADCNASARLLVVDDDANNRDMLSRRLQRRGFTVDTAADGFGAIDAIDGPDASSFDLVLLDVEMPGMSGFDVLRKVRETHPATRLPVIIATARHDREDIVAALGLGANDYVTKPIDFPVVLARVEAQLTHKRAVDRIVALEADVRRHNDELQKANARMRRSLELAAQVQRSLLPAATPFTVAGTEFAWRFDPCDELGGDIFNAFAMADGQVGFYLLDVSGHGVPAALLSVTLSRVLAAVGGPSLVQRMTQSGELVARRPADVVAELNLRFPLCERDGQYFTIFYGVFDHRHNRLTYVSAGHPPALLVPAAGPVRALEGDGFAVGWFDNAAFDEQTIDLMPGDRVFVFSDGITETMDERAELFGQGRLADVLAAHRGGSLQDQIDATLHAVDAFRHAEALDDLSLLAVAVPPIGGIKEHASA